MIVEDEDMIRKGLVFTIDWLSMDCVVVAEASNGQEGYERILEYKPDVVIADICMPFMDGIEMIQKASEKVKFKSILLTSYAEFDYARRAIEARVCEYLLKPVDEDTLIPAVKIAIHNYKQREAMAKEFHKTQEALDDRKYLDRAKGLVMERKNMSEKEAFTYIRSLSMDKGISMTELSKMLLKAYEG
jgi:two-component system response regulator YesN